VSKGNGRSRVTPPGRVDPLDRLVKVTIRMKRRHYEALEAIARDAGQLSLAAWLRTLYSPHLWKK